MNADVLSFWSHNLATAFQTFNKIVSVGDTQEFRIEGKELNEPILSLFNKKNSYYLNALEKINKGVQYLETGHQEIERQRISLPDMTYKLMADVYYTRAVTIQRCWINCAKIFSFNAPLPIDTIHDCYRQHYQFLMSDAANAQKLYARAHALDLNTNYRVYNTVINTMKIWQMLRLSGRETEAQHPQTADNASSSSSDILRQDPLPPVPAPRSSFAAHSILSPTATQASAPSPPPQEPVVTNQTAAVSQTQPQPLTNRSEPKANEKKRKRIEKTFTVLADSNVIFNPKEAKHRGKVTEVITSNLRYKRRPIVVLKRSYVKFDPDNPAHRDKETEVITTALRNTRKSLQKRVKVLNDSHIEFDLNDPTHREKETELITKLEQTYRRRAFNKQQTGASSRPRSRKASLKINTESHPTSVKNDNIMQQDPLPPASTTRSMLVAHSILAPASSPPVMTHQTTSSSSSFFPFRSTSAATEMLRFSPSPMVDEHPTMCQSESTPQSGDL